MHTPVALATLFALACTDPAPRSTPAPALAPKSIAPLSVNCPSTLVAHFNHLVQTGCTMEPVEDAMGLIPRLLRNVPYAARGHRFKDPSLQIFFATEKAGCDSPWYTPGETPITLPTAEAACVDKLKAHENTLRKALPIPPQVEAFVLQNAIDWLVKEVGRHVGKPWYGSRVWVEQTDKGGWSIHLYEEEPMKDAVSPMNMESSLVIRCTAEADCEALLAG